MERLLRGAALAFLGNRDKLLEGARESTG